MAVTLSPAAAKTLNTVIAAGGTMQGFAKQAGFDCRTIAALVRKGYLVKVTGTDLYAPVAVTDAGRAAVAPVEAPATVTPVILIGGARNQYAADYTQAQADSVDAAMRAARARRNRR